VGVNRRGSNDPDRGRELTDFTAELELEIAQRRLPEAQ
jgi:hypothetical protein